MTELRYTVDRLTERVLEGIEQWRVQNGRTWKEVARLLNDMGEHDIAEWWENYSLDGEEDGDEA